MLGDWRILRTFNRDIWLATGSWAASAFAYFGVQGVLLNLYLVRLGFSLEFIGVLIGAGQVVWALAALPAGALGRRVGLRASLALAHGVMALGIALFLLVESLPRPLWEAWLFGTWMLLWVGAALQAVNATPYLTHVTSPPERGHAFSAQSAVLVVMGFAGSLAAGVLPGLIVAQWGGSLDQPGPYRAALWLAPPLYALGIVFRLASRPVAAPAEPAEARSASAALPLGLFGLIGLIAFFQTASEGAVRAFFNVYLDTALKVPVAQIGTILGIGQGLSLAAVLYMPQMLARLGTRRTMLRSTLVLALAILPLALWRHWLPATAAFIVIMATAALNANGRQLLSQEIVPPRLYGTSAAVITIGLGAGWAATAALGGYAVGLIGFGGLFGVTAGVASTAALLLGLWRRH
jgi:hypothetical protein